MAIVAMCTRQVNKGVILLLSTFVGMGTSAFISFVLVVGVFAHAVGPVVKQLDRDLERQREAQQQAIRTLNSSLNQILQVPKVTIPTPSPATPRPSLALSRMNARELLSEITRLEKDQRVLRSIDRDLSKSEADYLVSLRQAYDRAR